VPELLEVVDGVILSGGADLDPALWGEPGREGAESIVPERGAFELALVRAVLERDAPILGICRGVQSLNVAAGGSLHVDILAERPGATDHRDGTPLDQVVHPVEIDAGSRLAALCGARVLRVNSWHHQAVKDVTKGFRATAWAPDGVIEAIEHPEHRFAIGVQWHPENLWERDDACARLFQAFIAACAQPARAARPACPRDAGP
jgi:putative glutamine amidotransferase